MQTLQLSYNEFCMAIRICTSLPTYKNPAFTNTVLDSITSTSTTAAFDQIVNKNPHFDFSGAGRGNGWHVLNAAASIGNAPLVKHIIEKSQKHTLNLGNTFGMTALYSACEFNILNRFQTVEILLDHGADVNLATRFSSGDSELGESPAKATPLWAAVQKVRDVSVTTLLLFHSALLGDNEIDSEARKILTQAETNLNQQKENIPNITPLPPELSHLIFNYAGPSFSSTERIGS